MLSKKRVWQEEKAKCMAIAIEFYYQEQGKADSERKLGLRKICVKAQQEYLSQSGTVMPVPNHNTLHNLATGWTVPKSQVNAERSWLAKEEVETVINYIVECAETGFGLDHRRLKEHVDEIAQARYGEKFLKEGIGKQWTHRFVERHHAKLHTYTARPLHDVRGKAANPEMNEKWFDFVEDIQVRGDDGNPMAPECTFAFDKSGLQANGDEGHTKIIGGKGKKIAYKQQAGSRETTTIIITIGADGTALPPTILFAGKGFLVKWKQNNPANAS